MVAIIIVVVSSWSMINRRRFAYRDRRKAVEPVSDAEIADHFGIPFALKKIAGILSSKEVLTIEKLLEDTTLFNEQVVENLINYQYQRVSDGQRRVLEALAIYNKPVSADAVHHLLATFGTRTLSAH